MEAFSQFASDLDAATQRLLARGSRLTQLLVQPQYAPMPVEEQIVVLFAGTRGYLDGIAVNRVRDYEVALLDDIRANGKQILDKIRKEKALSDELEAEIAAYLKNFGSGFVGKEEKAA